MLASKNIQRKMVLVTSKNEGLSNDRSTATKRRSAPLGVTLPRVAPGGGPFRPRPASTSIDHTSGLYFLGGTTFGSDHYC